MSSSYLRPGRALPLVAGLILLALTAACAEIPRATPTPPPPTATATPAGTPTLTQSPTATHTITPTYTPTPPPTATPDAASALLADFPLAIVAVYPAPDEMRRAEVLSTDCVAVSGTGAEEQVFEAIRIIDTAAQTEYQLDSRLTDCAAPGPWGFSGRAWSPSGRYFYYTTERQGKAAACGPTSPFIIRVDTTDWTQSFLGEATFAPDGLAIASWVEGELVIWSAEGEETARSQPVIPFATSGPPVWSPDGATLVYLQAHSFCEPGAGALVQVDVASGASRVLLETSAQPYVAVTWDEAGQLALQDAEGVAWRFDPATGALSAGD